MNLYLKAWFLVVLFLHVALVKLTFIIPARTIALFAFTGLLFLVHHREFVGSIKRHFQVYLVFAVMAFLGAFLGFLQREGLYTLAEYFLRNTIQPVLIFLAVYLSIKIFGLRFVVKAIFFFAAASSIIAILQFIGVDAAWDVRRFLGIIQGDPPHIKHMLRTGGRPMGLILTQIMFSYHVVSTYVIANLLYRQGLINPRFYTIIVIVALLGSAANGTRSLVLAILVHEGIMLATRAQLKSYMLLLVGAVVAAAGFFYLSSAGSRITSVADASAVGRIVLMKFGLQLFLDNPLGLGWGVRAADHAWLYWEHLSDLPKADAVYRLGIHNAYINFLLQYGIFGLGFMMLLAVIHLRQAVTVAIAFLPYFINAFFHNAVVFVGELYFWFAFAVFVHVYERGRSTELEVAAGTNTTMGSTRIEPIRHRQTVN